MADLRIRHPKAGTAVPHSFAAFGKDDKASAWVRAVLLSGKYLIEEGTTIVEPPNWVIMFENVRNTKIGESFTLEVRDGDGSIVRLNPIYVDRRAINLSYPLANDAVCCDFVTYGTTDSTSNVTGTMTVGRATLILGTTIQQPNAQGTWAIQFQGIPDGSYQLEISNAAGDSTNQAPINVAAANCS
jgi:hypothetical protein